MTTTPAPSEAMRDAERMLAEFEAAGPRFKRSAETMREWIENFRQQWREGEAALRCDGETNEQRTNTP